MDSLSGKLQNMFKNTFKNLNSGTIQSIAENGILSLLLLFTYAIFIVKVWNYLYNKYWEKIVDTPENDESFFHTDTFGRYMVSIFDLMLVYIFVFRTIRAQLQVDV